MSITSLVEPFFMLQVVAIPKTTAEDTMITATHISGETRTIPIPKGTDFELNVVGLHYNR
jgi:hypothetical protein